MCFAFRLQRWKLFGDNKSAPTCTKVSVLSLYVWPKAISAKFSRADYKICSGRNLKEDSDSKGIFKNIIIKMRSCD